MPKTIEKLMLEEHKRLEGFIDDLERDLKDYKKTKRNFNCLKWNIEKHFFSEEKVIFNSFVRISGKETNDIFSLLEEHGKIMQLLKKIELRLHNKIKPDLIHLKEALSTHRDFEDEEFYPNLDERLTPNQKKEISKKIKAIAAC